MGSDRKVVLAFAASGLLLLGAAPTPKPATPYSLVIGTLVSQRDAPGNPCAPDEDLCMDVMMETRLADVDVLAGNRTPVRLRIHHRQHAPYVPRDGLRLAMIVGANQDGIRRGVNLGTLEGGKLCVDKSWFDPANEGMALPRGRKVNADDNVCFSV